MNIHSFDVKVVRFPNSLQNLRPIHTGRGAACNRHMQIMEHTAVNRNVHTGCKTLRLRRGVRLRKGEKGQQSFGQNKQTSRDKLMESFGKFFDQGGSKLL